MAAAVVARTTGGPVNTPEDLVFISQTDPLVTATPFLLWQPAAAVGRIAQVTLSQQAMMSHFIGRCDRDGADAPTLLAFSTRTPLDLAFEGGRIVLPRGRPANHECQLVCWFGRVRRRRAVRRSLGYYHAAHLCLLEAASEANASAALVVDDREVGVAIQ